MTIDFTTKQKQVWRESVEKHHRWNISYGATRSGKTYLDYYKIPYRIRNAADEGLIILLGNTKGTLERNILDPLRQIWSDKLVGYIGSNNKVNLFGRECYGLGADKITQVKRLQGSGIEYAYGDEVATWHPDVFTMLKSRLDKPGSCFDGTCNPEHPGHWFKKFLESDADIYQMLFTIDDNTFLDPNFIAQLKKEYSGTVFYERFIKGLWVAAEGIIYRRFADRPEDFIIDKAPEIVFANIGVDFGGSGSAHTFTCTGFTRNMEQVVTLDEYYSKKEMDPTQLSQEFVDFIKVQIANYNVVEVFADSAEQVLIRGLRNALAKEGIRLPVKDAYKGRIIDRIRFYTLLHGAGKYKVMRHCKHIIDAFSTALWNSKKLNDERLDDGTTNIDSLDAQEYSTEKYQKQIIDLMLLGK